MISRADILAYILERETEIRKTISELADSNAWAEDINEECAKLRELGYIKHRFDLVALPKSPETAS